MAPNQGVQCLYRKFPKYSDTQNICCNHSKIWTKWLYHRVMSPNDADGMANSVDPDQTAPLEQSDLGLHYLLRPICPKTSENYGNIHYQILSSLFLEVLTSCISYKWAPSRENLSSGFATRLKPACSATETSYKLEVSDRETRGIVLSRQWITKTLIRLHRCAGWFVSLLFAYGIRQAFSWCDSNVK